MLSTFTTLMDLSAFEVEALYEMEDQYPIIYRVTLLKTVTDKETDVWFSPDGAVHTGTHYLRRDMTDFLSESQLSLLAADIIQHREEVFADTQADIAQERALERYMQFPDYFEGPMHFTGAMIT